MSLVAYTASDGESDSDSEELQNGGSTAGSDNPAPKELQHGGFTADSDNPAPEDKVDLDDVVEEEYKMRIPASAKTSHAALPAKRKLLLSLPALEDFDSDDEDDMPVDKSAKKVKPSQSASHGTSGLLSLLPQPKALFVKEGNRTMIPLSVMRRPPTVPKPVVKKISAPVKPNTMESPVESLDNDEDQEDGGVADSTSSFFSFYDASEVQAAPLIPTTISRVSEPVSTCPVGSSTSGTQSEGGSYGPQPTYVEDWDVPTSSSVLADSGLSEADMMRAFGRRAQRELSTPVVEIRQDDMMAGVQVELTKNITRDEGKQVSMPDKDDEPGKLAARKHQITWLAFKAKEREFELQNQWSDQKYNKNQSRAKYGF